MTPTSDDLPRPPAAADHRSADTGRLTGKAASDLVLEERLGTILRTGVYASSVFLAIGLVLSLATGLTAASAWLMTAGLVMLMATPVARVAVSVVQYAVARDRTFFVLTSIVLAELGAGIIAALVFHRRL